MASGLYRSDYRPPEPGFNPLATARGAGYQRHLDAFARAENPGQRNSYDFFMRPWPRPARFPMRFRPDTGPAQGSMHGIGDAPLRQAVSVMMIVFLFPLMLPLAAWLAATYHLPPGLSAPRAHACAR
jgi:hypothetical protein